MGLNVYFQVIPDFVYVSSRGSGKTADNQNLMCWLNCFLLLVLNRGSYMSAHVLLNLLNELGKRDKMRGLPSILSLFRNEFNKFNNTRARM